RLICFFFNDTATTEIYTLSLHDALPIWTRRCNPTMPPSRPCTPISWTASSRSEEHTSELQSRQYLVCSLLLEKKKHKSHHPYGHKKHARELPAQPDIRTR